MRGASTAPEGPAACPDYYYVIGWWAGLRITGDNFYETDWATDEWLDACYWYGSSYCEGRGELYYDPWLLQTGWDDGPGQTMTETGYTADGLAIFLEAICTEGYCWEVEWWVPAGWYAVAVPQQPPPGSVPDLFSQRRPAEHADTNRLKWRAAIPRREFRPCDPYWPNHCRQCMPG